MFRARGHKRRDGYENIWVGEHLHASNFVLGLLIAMLFALLVTYGLTLAATFQTPTEFL